jgi:hypothetical protein
MTSKNYKGYTVYLFYAPDSGGYKAKWYDVYKDSKKMTNNTRSLKSLASAKKLVNTLIEGEKILRGNV